MAITPMDRELARLLNEGQAAAKRGDKAMARALLTQLVEKEPRHEEAWMWLSGVVTDPFEQQICLENALVINPGNAQARKGLEYLAARTGQGAPAHDNPPAMVSEAAPANQPAPADIASPFGDSAPFGQAALPADGVPPWALGDPEFQPDLPQPEQHEGAPALDPSVPTPPYAVAMVPPMPEAAAGPVAQNAADLELPADAQPFVVPEAHSGNGSDDGIPDWLGNLTPSVQIAEEPQYTQSYAPFNHSEFAVPAPASAPPTAMVGDMPGDMMGMAPHEMADAGQPHTDPGIAAQAAPAGMLGGSAPDLGPMGPYADFQMPAPDELPGGGPSYSTPTENYTPPAENEQPWYLQRTTGNMPPMPDPGGVAGPRTGQSMADDMGGTRVATMVACPNCRESVPDTSLACPNCRYSFFVNCPFCHELVDTSDAKPGVAEPCPYCNNQISKMDMGLGTVNEMASQKNPGSRPGMPHTDPKHAFPSMQQQLVEGPIVERRPPFAWVVDLMWLVAVIVMVWALTQLPTWLNLSGQY